MKRIIIVLLLIPSAFTEANAKPMKNVKLKTSLSPNTKLDVMEESTAKLDPILKIPETLCDDCEIDYDAEDKPRNELIEALNELNGQQEGFPMKAIAILTLITICGLAMIGLIAFFCVKIFIRHN